MSVQLLFTRQHTFASALIRFLTGSTWSHVDVIDQQTNTVLGATRKKGVGEYSVKSRLNSARRASIMTIGGISDGPIKEWIREKEGVGFDWKGLFALVLRWFRLNDPNKYFCSELVAEAFKQAGCHVIKEGLEWKVTPKMLWEIGGMGKVHIIREKVK